MSRFMRYVVLHHTGWREDHHDLMLEVSGGGLLATWRVADWPCGDVSEVERLPDHRRLYLDYEGPVSGGRGRVARVDRGVWDVVGGRIRLVSDAGSTRLLPPTVTPPARS